MNMVIGLSLLILFTFGVPIAISIVLASIIGIEFFTRLPLLLVPQQMFIGIDKFPLMAIPFFILAGNLMAAGAFPSGWWTWPNPSLGGCKAVWPCPAY